MSVEIARKPAPRSGAGFPASSVEALGSWPGRKALDVRQSGERTEPPIRIPAPLGRASGDTGMALDPVHKEVIIATAAGNTIMTFSVPEVFDPTPSLTSSSR